MDLMMMIAAASVCLATSAWVYHDAQTIGVARGQAPGSLDMGPTGWLVACIVGWMVVFPAYLIMRDDYRRINGRKEPSSGRDRPAVWPRPQAGAIRWQDDDDR